jgi:hypothetical protein
MGNILAVLAVFALGMAGDCGSTATVDEPASNLEIHPLIVDSPVSGSNPTNMVSVQFLKGGSVVNLSLNDKLTCNGVTLTNTGLFGYAGNVPVVAIGGNYTFTYSRNGLDTSVSIQVPPRPTITKPQNGQNVVRDAKFTIEYVAGGGDSVRAGASDSMSAASGSEVADGQAASVDTAQFKAGPGSCNLGRTFKLTPTGTGFALVNVTYTTYSHAVMMTWQ